MVYPDTFKVRSEPAQRLHSGLLRKLGVDLFTLSLDEFYARLEEARRQYRQHVNAGRRADTFAYDNMEDSQI